MTGRTADPPRVDRYRKNDALESLLQAMNQRLAATRFAVPSAGPEPTWPVTFVVGLQRSGTTLLMQLLTRAFDFGYADNVVARFWGAPEVGVLVSRSLRAELGEAAEPTQAGFSSDYGTTDGPQGPHEFGYFWSRWFDFADAHELPASMLAKVDRDGLRAALAAMEAAWQKPLVFKAVPLSLNLPFLAECLPDALFVHVERDPLWVAHSTLCGRTERYGSADAWGSLKPAGWQAQRERSPAEQVAWQIDRSRGRVREGLHAIDPARVRTVRYEDLCDAPQAELDRLAAWLPAPPTGRPLPPRFERTPERRVSDDDWATLRAKLGGAP